MSLLSCAVISGLIPDLVVVVLVVFGFAADVAAVAVVIVIS